MAYQLESRTTLRASVPPVTDNIFLIAINLKITTFITFLILYFVKLHDLYGHIVIQSTKSFFVFTRLT